jgi:hypothetical protein
VNATKSLAAALLAFGLLGLSPVATSAVAATASPCGAAQRVLQRGNFADAETLYTGLASAKQPAATQECARQGLVAVDALSAAQQLFAAGLPQQADDEVVRALDAVPLLVLPQAVLPTTGQNGVKLAKTLDAEGFHQEARQLLEQVIDADPGIALDPTARSILQPPAPGFLARAGHVLQGIGNVVTSPVPAVVGIVLVLFFGLNVYYRRRRRLHLQPFAFSSAPVPGADPDQLRELVWDELKRLSDEDARTADDHALRLDLAGPYEGGIPLGSLKDALGPFRDIICGLGKLVLKKLVKGNARKVTGVLRPAISLRLDITTIDGVTEKNGSTVIKHADLGRLPDPDPAGDPVGGRFNQLALPAAAWIILTRFKDCTLGGTRDWQSFARFGAGCAWVSAKDLAEAEACFEDAYSADRDNLAAALNLGALLVQTAVGDGAAAQARRRYGYELLKYVADKTQDRKNDLQWYRARYLLPLAILDFGGPTGDGTQTSDEDRSSAAQYAAELAAELLERDLDPGDLPEKFQENSLGAALVLAAREHVPTTSDPTEVSTDASAADLAADPESLILLLRNPPQKGTPEKLTAYAARCKKTPQLDYNMYRYQQERVQLYAGAEGVVAARRDNAAGPEREQLEAQLRDLEAARTSELAALAEFRQGVEDSGDPLLLAAIATTPDFARETGSATTRDRTDGDGARSAAPDGTPPRVGRRAAPPSSRNSPEEIYNRDGREEPPAANPPRAPRFGDFKP